MTNPFANVSADGLEEAQDVLGGGKFNVPKTGLHTAIIKAAYSTKSSGGATAMNFIFNLEDGTVFRETIYVTNKQGEIHYLSKDGKNKKIPLPGYTTANDIAMLSTGHDLTSQNFEEKVISLYDYDAKKEVPTKVLMATEMLDKTVTLGLRKSIEDKTVKQGNDWVPNGQTFEKATINKVFHKDSGRTLREFLDGEAEGKFIKDWEEANKSDRVFNNAKGAGTVGTPSGGGSATGGGNKPRENLFG